MGRPDENDRRSDDPHEVLRYYVSKCSAWLNRLKDLKRPTDKVTPLGAGDVAINPVDDSVFQRYLSVVSICFETVARSVC